MALTLGIGACASSPAFFSMWYKEDLNLSLTAPSVMPSGYFSEDADTLTSLVHGLMEDENDRPAVQQGDTAFGPDVGYAADVPPVCIEAGNEIGIPVSYSVGAIIDPPILTQRLLVEVPENPNNRTDFLCAVFLYSVDRNGRVFNIKELYGSYKNEYDRKFLKKARQTLSRWRYKPGMVDKGYTAFTGFTTVFYHAY